MTSSKKEFFGLFSYNTENIGDEIQSIAARRFLPQVDSYVDRDNIGTYQPTHKGSPTKLIMNGWYMHAPFSWPPQEKNIKPLLTSIFINQEDPKVTAAFESEESLEFLRANGPVGARDEHTLDYLQKLGVPSYFSGCVTLTLQREESIPKGDFILAVDVSDKVIAAMRASTDRRVIAMSVNYAPMELTEDKMSLAEYYLYLYQTAHCVVTSRLHATLPSLAFETPVLLVKDAKRYDPKRYSGLDRLARTATEAEYLADPAGVFDINRPPANKRDYLPLREAMIKRCKDFTGYDERTSFLTRDLAKMYSEPWFIAFFAKGQAETHKLLLSQGDVSWLQKVQKVKKKELEDAAIEQQNLQKQLSALEQEHIAVLRSLSWRLTRPLRWLRSHLRFNTKKGEI